MFMSIAVREQAPQEMQRQRRATIARIDQARESGPSRRRAWKPKMIAVQIRAVPRASIATRDASDVKNCIPPTEVQQRCDVPRWVRNGTAAH